MSALYDTLRADIITAMKARESAKATGLRTADAAVQRAAMDGNAEIDDALVVTTLRKIVKNLADANEAFARAGRRDLVADHQAEITWLEVYLPPPLVGEKLEEIVAEAIASTGARSRQELGQVMRALKSHPESDRIDFGAASKVIQSRFS